MEGNKTMRTREEIEDDFEKLMGKATHPDEQIVATNTAIFVALLDIRDLLSTLTKEKK